MVLFVFEGKKPEIPLFGTLDSHFLNIGGEKIVATFHTNIYKLYEEIHTDQEVHTFDVLKTWLTENNHTEEFNNLKDYKARDFTEIYLFFDYDVHAATSYLNLTLEKANNQIKEMLELFNDESDLGKLYISYPMVESYLYTKKMPDADFVSYTFPIGELNQFKKLANEFSGYNQNDFTSSKSAADNWRLVIQQNIAKASLLCTNNYDIPLIRDEVSQAAILAAEVENYVVPHQAVSVLCGLPLFVFEYLRADLFQQRVLGHSLPA